MFLVTSPIVINVPTRGLLAVETMYAIVQWLANLNIKRNVCKQETSLYTPYRIAAYCNLVVLSTTLRHQEILAARFEGHFLRAKSHNFQVL